MFETPPVLTWSTAATLIQNAQYKRLLLTAIVVFSLAAVSHADSLSPSTSTALTNTSSPSEGSVLYTDGTLYLRDAWHDVQIAQINGPNADKYWMRAVAKVSQMLSEHKDWSDIAKEQNIIARRSTDRLPLNGRTNLTPHDLEPVLKKYWALYNVGTAEFILVLGNANLRDLAHDNGDNVASDTYNINAIEAARRILNYYDCAQTYDEKGWFWQPANAIHEYVDIPTE